MPRRIIDIDGTLWSVVGSGRVTQYTRDEHGLVYSRVDNPRERRVSRFSPLGSKSRELSLAQLSDADLIRFFTHSQPAKTAPELGYQR